MRQFMVRVVRDGRLLLREAESIATLKATLVEGYEIEHEILNGLSVRPLPDALPRHTIMSHLLVEHGDELREWLKGEIAAAVAAAVKHRNSVDPVTAAGPKITLAGTATQLPTNKIGPA